MTTAQKKPEGLLAKLHAAQKAASNVAKQGTNTQQHYKYARAEDVIREAREALHGAGLVATMTYGELQTSEISSSKGTGGHYVVLPAALRIADPESAEILEVPSYGAGIDYPGDKAVYKAMTGAAKYAYASALGIAFGDDPEDEKSDHSRRSNGSHGFASPKQEDYFRKLLAGAGAKPDTVNAICAYAVAELDGARGGGISKSIDGLREGKKEIAKTLAAEAVEWQAKQSDIPADMTDLAEAE